jgi:hypothetical protein
LEAAANGGIKLHPTSLAALHSHRHGGQLLPWVLCALLAGVLLVLIIA